MCKGGFLVLHDSWCSRGWLVPQTPGHFSVPHFSCSSCPYQTVWEIWVTISIWHLVLSHVPFMTTMRKCCMMKFKGQNLDCNLPGLWSVCSSLKREIPRSLLPWNQKTQEKTQISSEQKLIYKQLSKVRAIQSTLCGNKVNSAAMILVQKAAIVY